MHMKLLEIGPFTVYTYGLMIAIGILAAFYVAEKRGPKLGLDTSHLEKMTLTVLLFGFLFSKILYAITRWHEIIVDPAILWSLSEGWVVYGGILGGLFGGLVYCRLNHLNFLAWFDFLIPEVALAQGFGRIGCFFAGCCYGIQVPWGVVFPADSLAPAGVPLLPTQLISSLFDFALFGFLLWVAAHKKFNGEVGAWYLILYSLGRFILEFYRGDLVRGAVGTLSTSQFISIFTLVLGILLLVMPRFKKQQ